MDSRYRARRLPPRNRIKESCKGVQATEVKPTRFRNPFQKFAAVSHAQNAQYTSKATASLLLHHELDELVVVNSSVAVLVGLPNHLIDLVIGQLLADGGHDVAQFGSGDEAVVVTVKDLERFPDFLLGIRVLHLAGHHGEEFGEVNGAVVVGVDLVDHVLQLGLAGVLTKRAHDCAQLFGGDLTITVLVKQRKGLLELGDLLLSERISHRCCGECGRLLCSCERWSAESNMWLQWKFEKRVQEQKGRGRICRAGGKLALMNGIETGTLPVMMRQPTMGATNSWMLAAMLSILLIKSSISPTNAQQTITTPCSSSMISSFTPCLNFVTGSSGGGSSPTQECCNVLRSLTVNNMDCACLIITGSVPVSIPFINANLGISLPRACKSSVPLQCKASGVPLPAPGPILFTPPPPPTPVPHVHVPASAPAPAPVHARARSPKGSKAVTTAAAPPPAESLDIAPSPSSPPRFPLGPSANPGIRPVVNPKSAASNLVAVSLSYLVIMFGGIIASKFF